MEDKIRRKKTHVSPGGVSSIQSSIHAHCLLLPMFSIPSPSSAIVFHIVSGQQVLLHRTSGTTSFPRAPSTPANQVGIKLHSLSQLSPHRYKLQPLWQPDRLT